jgi:hypothetical protein
MLGVIPPALEGLPERIDDKKHAPTVASAVLNAIATAIWLN